MLPGSAILPVAIVTSAAHNPIKTAANLPEPPNLQTPQHQYHQQYNQAIAFKIGE